MPAVPPSFRAYVGLGGNLGDVHARLHRAVADLGRLPRTVVEAASEVYRTKPVDASGPDYLNAVVALQSGLGPHELLHALLNLERDHDRTRPYRHAPRTLDLDLLWFDGLRVNSPDLSLPHPRALERAFVLEPWFDLIDTHGWSWPADLPKPSAVLRQKMAQEQGIFKLDGVKLL